MNFTAIYADGQARKLCFELAVGFDVGMTDEDVEELLYSTAHAVAVDAEPLSTVKSIVLGD